MPFLWHLYKLQRAARDSSAPAAEGLSESKRAAPTGARGSPPERALPCAAAYGGARCGAPGPLVNPQNLLQADTPIPEKYIGETFAMDNHSVGETVIVYTQRFVALKGSVTVCRTPHDARRTTHAVRHALCDAWRSIVRCLDACSETHAVRHTP